MSAPQGPHAPGGNRRWLLLAGVCAAALVGFVLGIRPPAPIHEQEGAAMPQASGPVVPAAQWSDIHQANLGPNAGWKTDLDMAGPQTVATTALPTPSPEAKAKALAARAERRAFAGAPPRTPHRVDGMSVYACQSCHGDGLTVNAGQVVAPQMPHPLYLNCLQCHETLGDQPPGGPPAGREEVASGGTFVGAVEAANGPRFLPGAPPQIPHPTLMRTHCMSCHGPLGQQALKTPHPDRRNCQQCHAPGAALDQRGEPVEFRAPPAIQTYIDGARPGER